MFSQKIKLDKTEMGILSKNRNFRQIIAKKVTSVKASRKNPHNSLKKKNAKKQEPKKIA